MTVSWLTGVSTTAGLRFSNVTKAQLHRHTKSEQSPSLKKFPWFSWGDSWKTKVKSKQSSSSMQTNPMLLSWLAMKQWQITLGRAQPKVKSGSVLTRSPEPSVSWHSVSYEARNKVRKFSEISPAWNQEGIFCNVVIRSWRDGKAECEYRKHSQPQALGCEYWNTSHKTTASIGGTRQQQSLLQRVPGSSALEQLFPKFL